MTSAIQRPRPRWTAPDTLYGLSIAGASNPADRLEASQQPAPSRPRSGLLALGGRRARAAPRRAGAARGGLPYARPARGAPRSRRRGGATARRSGAPCDGRAAPHEGAAPQDARAAGHTGTRRRPMRRRHRRSRTCARCGPARRRGRGGPKVRRRRTASAGERRSCMPWPTGRPWKPSADGSGCGAPAYAAAIAAAAERLLTRAELELVRAVVSGDFSWPGGARHASAQARKRWQRPARRWSTPRACD